MTSDDTISAPELTAQSLAALVKYLAAEPGGVVAYTAACLKRIERLDARLRCMVYVDHEAALERAAELDAANETVKAALPLYGIPVVVKEIFAVNGMPASTGSRASLTGVVSDEGPFVQSLRDAGCVLLGKSLSTEFAFGQFNLGRPMPVNPAVTSEDRVTGGSSSGSAGAMAAGYCGFAIGTDTGGSVRAPAAFTGVVGFKPTQGLWSAQGVFPLARGLDTPGLFTRSVGDAASIFTALTGQHLDGLAVPGQLRIGVAPAYFTAGLDGVVADAWHKTLGTLAAAGHELVPLTLAGLPVVEDFYATEVPLELLQTLGAEQLFAQQGLLDPLTLSRLAAVRDNVSDRELLGLIDRLVVDCQAELSAAQLDCWLAPTVPVVAPMHAELAEIEALQQWQALASRNTRVINILKLPALSLPLQASLPVGLQVVVAEGADAMLLAIAGELEVLLAAD